MEMRKISKGAGVLLIAAAMIFSAVVVTAETENITPTLNSVIVENGKAPQTIGPVVWDNGMDYIGLAATQWDENLQFDSYLADDFHFDEDTEVCDVHWIGGYWVDSEPASAEFDWCISFMYDDGSGEAPDSHPTTPSYYGPVCYTWAEINKEEIEPGYYEMWVDLPENLVFLACEKFWISIWGVGLYPPQSGWGYHERVLLHQAVWGSVYFNIPFWTDIQDVLPSGIPADMCFQLTTKPEPEPPTPPTIEGPNKGVPCQNYTFIFHSDDPNCDDVKYIIDWGDGTTTETDYFPHCTPVEVTHHWEEMGTYVIKAKAEDETGLQSTESTHEIEIPRSRAVHYPLLFKFLARFPILKALLGL